MYTFRGKLLESRIRAHIKDRVIRVQTSRKWGNAIILSSYNLFYSNCTGRVFHGGSLVFGLTRRRVAPITIPVKTSRTIRSFISSIKKLNIRKVSTKCGVSPFERESLRALGGRQQAHQSSRTSRRKNHKNNQENLPKKLLVTEKIKQKRKLLRSQRKAKSKVRVFPEKTNNCLHSVWPHRGPTRRSNQETQQD